MVKHPMQNIPKIETKTVFLRPNISDNVPNIGFDNIPASLYIEMNNPNKTARSDIDSPVGSKPDCFEKNKNVSIGVISPTLNSESERVI